MTSTPTFRKPVPPQRLKGGLGVSPTTPLISPNKIQQPRKLLALDTETTGVDFWHGCRPFFVSVLDDDGNTISYEWDVDPYTRTVIVPQADLLSLEKLIKQNDLLMHNTKFDIRALQSHGLPTPRWEGIHDTLIASHVLVSNESHKLKDLALQYLDVSDDDQQALMEASNHARRYARQWGWRLANEGDPHFPAQKRPENGWWMLDTWMPRAVCQRMWQGMWLPPGPDLDRPAPLLPPKRSRSAGPLPTGPTANWDWRPPGTDGPDDPGHPWWTICRTYAIRDVERTYGLWFIFKDELEQQGLWQIYQERRDLLQPIYEMEDNGATIAEERRTAMVARLEKEASLARRECLRLCRKAGVQADDKTLNSPKQLSGLLYGTWKLPASKLSAASANALANGESLAPPGQGRIVPAPGDKVLDKNGRLRPDRRKAYNVPELQYATDADTLKNLLDRAKGPAQAFITNLLKNRKCERTLAYIHEYTTRSVHTDSYASSAHLCGQQQSKQSHRQHRTVGTKALQWLLLHGNFNITGTDTTRFSSSAPNLQNIGKQVILDAETKEVLADYNLRRIFGPAPGREWYSIDYSNIELRIFAYESGDAKLIEAFEQGYKVHCIIAELLHPKAYAECREEAYHTLLNAGRLKHNYVSQNKVREEVDLQAIRKATEDLFSTRYESSLYQWTKNGTFALIYGAGRPKADATYRVPGAYDMIRNRLPLIDDFLQSKNYEAREKGYIRCKGGVPDPGRRVHATMGNSPVISPKGNGYRLWVPQREPHVAVNYFIQGTAGWCMIRAINRCHRYLADLNRRLFGDRSGFSSNRNEIEGYVPQRYKMIMTIHDEIVFDFPQHPRNLEVITKIARLMEASGDDVGVPTPVGVERHVDNWAEGEKLKV